MLVNEPYIKILNFITYIFLYSDATTVAYFKASMRVSDSEINCYGA